MDEPSDLVDAIAGLSLADDTKPPPASIPNLFSELLTYSNSITRLNNSIYQGTVYYILSLVDKTTEVHKILLYFEDELKSIVRDLPQYTRDRSDPFLDLIEYCYTQCLDPSGILYLDNYFESLSKVSSTVDENHALFSHVTHGFVFEQKRKRRKEKEEEWIGFWVQLLAICPHGPTLFYPSTDQSPQGYFSNVPRYLFRAFDSGSSGKSDDNIVASLESISKKSNRSKIDIFTRTEKGAAEMLHRHLTKPLFEPYSGWEEDDNLMSWSSSLLFVIQYAIWRCHYRHCYQDEVRICMVDTRKFPRGQFMRDMDLIEAYYPDSAHDSNMRSFFNFRLNRKDYDNGEYLSQGELHHTGRSSVFSLAQLVEAGLYDLYPEFADSSATGSWAKRVRSLRSEWSMEHTTTDADIRKAKNIARECFKPFSELEGALLLLAFKNCELETTKESKRSQDTTPERLAHFEDCGPSEVQRYMEFMET